ncbi:Phosphatidic acid phosphatase (PAP2) family protein [Quillaja saponaria]|uniref:Phosphatidic acid phosphatase (PAP2) family protein n=1 Tax=Quillaja saponaria TaxID=32244 RepID=A0AAD7L6R7_QUISA|nr:Phosphatidic acid phosphatase (PAP2) family protein [Quillaja saponaria]
MDPPPTSKPATDSHRSPLFLRHIISLDTSLSHSLHTLTKPILPQFLLHLLELSADFRFFFPVTLSTFLATPSSSPLRTQFLSPLIICSLLDLFVIALVKFLVGRSRPIYNNHGKYKAVVSVDNFSFPSGHSSRVCSIASLFYLSESAIIDAVAGLKAEGRGGVGLVIDGWIGGDEVRAVNFLILFVWMWAIVTSLSRVFLGRHFVLDVFVGAALGVLEALFTFHFLRY